MSSAAVPLPDLFTSEDWLTLLDVSLTGIHLVRPVYQPDGPSIVDFAIEYLNSAAQRMTGLGEQPGGTLLGRFPHALAEGIFDYYRRVFETGEQLTYETNYQADGLDNFFRFSARRSGAHLLVSFTDTSDQNRSAVELALRESQAQAQAETEVQRQRLHQLVAKAPAMIATLRGPEHVVELANDGFRAIFGGRDLVGKPYREAIPEFESQPFFDRLDAVYRTGQTYYGIDEPVILDRTNSGQLEHTYITYTYQATRDAQGQIDGILVFCYEVTEQVLARQERDQQRQRLQNLFMQAPAAICILAGPELVYELVNPNYQLFFPERQLLGKPLREALPELADHAAYYTMRRVFDTGEPLWQQALHAPLARTPGGVLEDRYFNYIQQPRYDEQGCIDGVLVFGFEVTEMVQARQQVQDLNEELAAINEELTATNEELHETNAQLTRTNADLDTFVYTASHDLKAPISNIEGLLNALQSHLPDQLKQDNILVDLLGMMQNAAERFKTTISHLTDISQLQRFQNQSGEQVNLADIIEDVRLDLLPELEATAAELSVQVGSQFTILFAPQHLRSVVYNLLSNALKYRHPERPPRVQLRAVRLKDSIVLSVQDNGLGLTEHQQSRLFGLFQRLHTHVEGSGVGLYAVKRLVENAGGTITVLSQVGEGSTFTVTLPAQQVR